MKKALINYIKNQKYDVFYTPVEAIKPIIDLVPKNWVIWECCDDTGDSNITKVFRQYGVNVFVLNKRIQYIKGKQNYFNTSWFFWDVGITKNRIMFLEVK